MATADELLEGILPEDKTLIVSNDFRTITIPASVPNIGVEHDDEVLCLDFKLPRYVSNTDLSVFKIWINYANANGETDAYEVNDAKTYSDHITFSWLVGPTATRYTGSTQFIICAKTTKDDGTIDKEFNTTIASLPVLQGLEVDEEIVTSYTDIIEQWKRELFGSVDSKIAEIESASEAEKVAIADEGARVLATIPVDYTTAVRMTDNADRTKSDAIICSVQGDTIQVEDSSDDFIRGLRIFGKTTQVSTTGKNLLDVEESLSFSYIYDKSIRIPAGTYVLTFESETHTGTYAPYVHFNVNGVGALLTKPGKQYTITLTTDETQLYIYANNYNASASEGISATINKLMLSFNGGEYEPYSGGTESPNPEYPQDLVDIKDPTISISGSTGTEYAPYQSQSITLTNTLSGIPVSQNGNYTDGNGQQWICDEIDFEQGKLIKRVKEVVCDGTEAWYVSSSSTKPYSLYLRGNVGIDVMCTHAKRLTSEEFDDGIEGVRLSANCKNLYLQLQQRFPTVTSLQEYLAKQHENGTPLIIRYAVQNTEMIDLTVEEIEWFRFAHTNCPNTTVFNDVGATMELKYNADTKTYLDNCFRPTDDQVQASVDAWLETHYTNAEGVRF